MGNILVRTAAPFAIGLGTLGLVGAAVAAPAEAAVKPAHTFSLRGKVVRIDKKTDRFELAVGKKDVTVEVRAAELATLKLGETVAVRGDIVKNVRVAKRITS